MLAFPSKRPASALAVVVSGSLRLRPHDRAEQWVLSTEKQLRFRVQCTRICWRLGRARVRQVLREDLETQVRDYRTIPTFMTRMTKKGWFLVEKQALKEEIRQFLDQVVGPEPENLDLVEEILAETRRST